jgi:DNA ligase 1
MKPMLLERKNPDILTLKYPIFGSYKLDGIRCVTTDKGPLSRTLKPIPNKFICSELGGMMLGGLDGELIVGDPYSDTVFNTTTSGVRRIEGQPDFTYYVFDFWDKPNVKYSARIAELEFFAHRLHPRIQYLPARLLDDASDVRAFEQEALNLGYEGIILRSPNGLYKYGRTTMNEGNAYKLKRFMDSEAYVIGMMPLMKNNNGEQTNELGRTFRSKLASGLEAQETMGALILKDPADNKEFSCGSGFSAEDRLWWFKNWEQVAKNKQLVTYKSFPVGVMDKPRHPIFKGIRMAGDV